MFLDMVREHLIHFSKHHVERNKRSLPSYYRYQRNFASLNSRTSRGICSRRTPLALRLSGQNISTTNFVILSSSRCGTSTFGIEMLGEGRTLVGLATGIVVVEGVGDWFQRLVGGSLRDGGGGRTVLGVVTTGSSWGPETAVAGRSLGVRRADLLV